MRELTTKEKNILKGLIIESNSKLIELIRKEDIIENIEYFQKMLNENQIIMYKLNK